MANTSKTRCTIAVYSGEKIRKRYTAVVTDKVAKVKIKDKVFKYEDMPGKKALKACMEKVMISDPKYKPGKHRVTILSGS